MQSGMKPVIDNTWYLFNWLGIYLTLNSTDIFSNLIQTINCLKKKKKLQIRKETKTTQTLFLPGRGRDMSCSPALFRHNDNKCTTLMGEAVPFQPDRPGKPLLFLLPDRSPARSPAAGASLHHSTEDLRVRRSANYGRLCECVLCHLQFLSQGRTNSWKVRLVEE